MDVRATASLRALVRVGFVVPRYKHTAVARNQLKRRLRELVRLEWLPVLPPMNVVLRVIPPAYSRDFEALRAEMRTAGERLARLTLPPPRHVDHRAPASDGSAASSDTTSPPIP